RTVYVGAELTRQPTARKWAEGLVGDPEIEAERNHVALVATFEQRVGVLTDRRTSEDDRLAQLVGVEVGHAPSLDQPGLDERLERRHRLLEWCFRIERVREVDVDPIDSEAVEAGFDLPHHPLAREA